ncbi:hypothetical protein PIROE2DRAFT_5307 [Piromyces sp. E2]|nr:hypothetical protein PIROE2DRAFT_5307 [Piromyces sp. E2]|eukprot:OUM67251.1 hypothetical protein PIROE2DRAFT_5307 [Piromyces sp. E2]
MPRLKHSKNKKKQDGNSSFIMLNPNDNYFNDDNSSIFDFGDSDKKNNTLSSPRIIGSLTAYANNDNTNNSNKNNTSVKESEIEKLNSIQQLIKDYNDSNEELQKLINQFKEGNKKYNDKAHSRTESNKENYSFNNGNHSSSKKYSKHGRSVSYNISRTNSQSFSEKLLRKGSVDNCNQSQWLKSPPMSPTFLNSDNRNNSSPASHNKIKSNSKIETSTVDPTKIKAGSTRIKQSMLTKQTTRPKNLPNQKRLKSKSSFTNLSKNSILDIINAIPSSFNEPSELPDTEHSIIESSQNENRRGSYDSDTSSTTTTTTTLSANRSIDYEKSSYNLFSMTANESRLKKSQSTSTCSITNEAKLPDFFYDTTSYLNGNSNNKKRDLFPSVRLNSSDSYTVPSLRDKNGYIIQNSSSPSVLPINIPISDINTINSNCSLNDQNDEYSCKNNQSSALSDVSSSSAVPQVNARVNQELKRSNSASLRSRTKEGYLVLNIKKPSTVHQYESLQYSRSEGMMNTSLSRNTSIHDSFSQNSNSHNYIRECEDRPYNTIPSSNVYPIYENEKSLNICTNVHNNNSNKESLLFPSSPPPQNYPYNYSHPHSHTMRRAVTADDHLNYRQTQLSGKAYHHLNHRPSRSRIDFSSFIDERERQTLPLYTKSSKSKSHSNSNSKAVLTDSTGNENHSPTLSDSSSSPVQESLSFVTSKVPRKPSLMTLYQSLLYLLQNFYRQCQQRIMKTLSHFTTFSHAIAPITTPTAPVRSNSEIHLFLNPEKNESTSSLLSLLYSYYQRYLLSPVQPILNQIQDIWLKLHLPIPQNSTTWRYATSVVLPAMIIIFYHYRKIKLNRRSQHSSPSSSPSSSTSSSPIITTNHS